MTLQGCRAWKRTRPDGKRIATGREGRFELCRVRRQTSLICLAVFVTALRPHPVSTRPWRETRPCWRRSCGVKPMFLLINDGFEVVFLAAMVGLLLISLMRTAPAGPLTPARTLTAISQQVGQSLRGSGTSSSLEVVVLTPMWARQHNKCSELRHVR